MKLLIANGCSHTAGTDIDPRNREYCPDKAWPRYVAEHYKMQYINLARSGSGNEQISRSTIANIANLIEIDNLNPKDITVTICWSGFDRYEYWYPTDDDFKSCSLASVQTTAHKYKTVGTIPQYIELRTLVEPEDYSYYKNLYYMYTTARFLESYGIEYYFANGINSFIKPDEFKSSPNLTKHYIDMIKVYGARATTHLGFFEHNNTLVGYLESMERSDLGQKNHWGEEGQEYYATKFLEHMETVNETVNS